MPGIYLFKRRWAIGSDDFVFPSFVELCIRFAWMLAISILFGIHRGSFSCPNGHLLSDYYLGCIVLLVVTLIHTLAIMLVSMQGSVRDGTPRRHINLLLYLKFAAFIPEAVWLVIGTYWSFHYSFSCHWPVYWAARGAVITAWIMGFWIIVGILLVFDTQGSAKRRVNLGDTMTKSGSHWSINSSKSQNIRVWETRCRCLCCCIAHSQDNDEAFSDVSKLVADFFTGVDLVPSDIAAGLMLVECEQRYAEGNLSAVVINSSPHPHHQPEPATLPTDVQPIMAAASAPGSGEVDGGGGPKSWMTVPTMAHYMKFALGSYGWPFYMYSNFFTGLCRLCANLRCCACMRKQNQVYSDNSCQCHTAAIKKLTQIPDQDLIYASFHNRYREIPFYVAVDRKFNNVVLSIRGTLSLQDALTDMSAKGVALEIEGLTDATCHDAMLDCAKFIKSQLEEKKLLEEAFSALNGEGRLMIVGHSLGAGVAAILAVLLRPRYSNLACFAYSPPGGLMSPNASHYARDFVCSVIVGEDIIPRLGMPTMWDLKVKVLRALCSSNTPKYKILATGCLRMLCSCLQSSHPMENNAEVSPLTRQGERRRYNSYTSPLESALKTAEECAREMVETEWPMHPPGQILHVVEDKESRLCGGDPQYSAVWAEPQDFSSILISRSMILDHLPDVVLAALQQLERKNFVPRAHRVPTPSLASDC